MFLISNKKYCNKKWFYELNIITKIQNHIPDYYKINLRAAKRTMRKQHKLASVFLSITFFCLLKIVNGYVLSHC